MLSPADLQFAYRWGAETFERYVADLAEEQWTAQPVEAINHPAWLLGHVSIYNPVIVALLTAQSFGDPWQEPCGKNSEPVADRSAYPAADEILNRFTSGVDLAMAAMADAPAEAWSAKLEHPTWGKQFDTVAPAVTFLSTAHLALHLGQLSGWRRAMGLPRV